MEIKDLEKLRKKVRNKRVISFLCALVSIGVFAFCCITLEMIFIIIGFIFLILSLFFFMLFGTNDSENFSLAYKEVVVEPILKTVFSNAKYIPSMGINPAIIENTQILRSYKYYSSRDYFQAIYKSKSVICASVSVDEDVVHLGGNIRTTGVRRERVFEGKWIIVNVHKPITTRLVICSKSFPTSLTLLRNEDKNLKRVETSDKEFNNKFEIYAQYKDEALNILTPFFIEKIKQIKNIVNYGVGFSFQDDKVHIALNTYSNFFERGIFGKITAEKEFEKFSKELKKITDIIDELASIETLFYK